MSRRTGWRTIRNRANASIAEALAVVAEAKAAEDAELRERVRAARQAEADRIRLTLDDVRGASFVRDEFGWHKVVRVNAKSVTVETGYSWTDRIPLDRIHEARAA